MEQVDKKTEGIKKAIVRAIVFFDLLGLPLTLSEIWKYSLILPGENLPETDLGEMLEIVEADLIGKTVEQKNGFYFLRGRSDLAAVRMRSQISAQNKYKAALKTAYFLKFIPGIKLVAVCNSLAMGNVRDASDIDFFIVTAKDRIWLTRLLVTVMTQILGMRRYKSKVNNRVCLSFYITENNLDLEKVALPVDPYFYYWLASLDPILDNRCFDGFIGANAWLKRYLPNFFPKMPNTSRRIENSFLSGLVDRINSFWFYSFLGVWLENLARFIQLKKMSKNKNSLAKADDTRVIISETMLKFHETDRRREFLEKWESKMSDF